MEQEHEDSEGLLSEEDKATAYSLAEALCEDNVEKFLQLYDEIPTSVSPRRLGNIKEMARQVAALTRASAYRHSPIPAKDLTFFGNSLQTSQLSLNGPLGANDFSAFKTPPEGRTPVDVKHFDYEDETLKTLETKSVGDQLVGLCNDNHLNDSGVLQEESSLVVDSEQNFKTIDMDVTKLDDDAFHTPPEFQDNAVPEDADKVISKVIDLLSKSSTDKVPTTSIEESFNEDTTSAPRQCENMDIEEQVTCAEQALSEKDSLDNSPVGSRKFTQEEDDSGISTVDENDASQDSPTATLNDSSFTGRKVNNKSSKRTPLDNHVPRLEKRTGAAPPENKHGKTYAQDSEDSVGWQTRCKKAVRKRDEFERKVNYNNYNTESYGQGEQSSMYDCSRRGARDGRFKDRNAKIDNQTYTDNATGDKTCDDQYTLKNGGTRSSRRNGDNDIEMTTSKRSGKRHGGNLPHGAKRQENRWTKNSTKDKFSETENSKEQDPGNSNRVAMQPTVFSYRDALLKASNSKDTNPSPTFTSKGEKAAFDLNAAASYLSSAWTSVKNLHRKDPSKVFIFSDD